jgi:hypothetical protein
LRPLYFSSLSCLIEQTLFSCSSLDLVSIVLELSTVRGKEVLFQNWTFQLQNKARIFEIDRVVSEISIFLDRWDFRDVRGIFQ